MAKNLCEFSRYIRLLLSKYQPSVGNSNTDENETKKEKKKKSRILTHKVNIENAT